MIQGGDPVSKDDTPNTKLEMVDLVILCLQSLTSNFFHKKGALAAARMGDAVNPKERIFRVTVLYR